MSMVQTVAAQGTDSKWWEAKSAPIEANTKSIQTITFSTGSFNDEDRTFVAIASTPIVDRYGDTVQQEGWVLDNFLKNPVVPWAHDYWQPPVARAVEIGVNQQGYLQFKYQAPPEGLYPFADTVWNLYRHQYMFAFSVGFQAMEADGSWDSGYNFTKCELLEISAVVVPANPQAVALAFDKGVIDAVQLKDLKTQIADSLKNVERLIAKSAEQAKDEVKAVAKQEAEAATKAVADNEKEEKQTEEQAHVDAGANTENGEEKAAVAATEAEGLTTDVIVDDTKGMETKAGATLSKANKDRLKAVHDNLADIAAKCQAGMTELSALLQLEVDEADEAKAATQVQQKGVEAEEQETTETAEETKEDVQQQGDDNADSKGDGEVNSVASGDADEGADHKEAVEATETKQAEQADDGTEVVDPDNLTPEQAAKVAAAVNEELEKLKQ